MQRALIVIGILVLVVGLLWPWVSQLPLGRLPGDIVVSKPGFRFFFPITTMILLSIVVSAILWFFRH
ncbi:MAG TPA: DUF2905 domain-containing protein [Woeseiaceae bacterium]|nr:DUF2905 domain-containing protein [Woeseiaceae bacterium]